MAVIADRLIAYSRIESLAVDRNCESERIWDPRDDAFAATRYQLWVVEPWCDDLAIPEA
jgi:hypothetical protein